MITAKQILDAANVHHSRAKSIWIFGSRVYGTADELSDWDAVVVANSSVEAREVKLGEMNIHVYTPDRWQKDLDWHNPKCLECHFAPEWATLIEGKHSLSLELNRLRHAVSHVSSNSWVKCKKKMNDGEYRTAIKSAFHSIRIPLFGTDIAKNGTITDFGAANHIWEELTSRTWTWEDIQKRFKSTRAQAMTEFRKHAEKR